MSSTVKAELNKSNPNNVSDLLRLLEAGRTLEVLPRTEQLAVTAHIATPSRPARTILSCFITAAGANTGEADVSKKETIPPAAGDCAINEDGNIQFAAADVVTECEVTYVPVEGELVEDEIIAVTAGGLGTLSGSKGAIQIVSATLNAPAVTPGAKVPEARGTAAGALAGSGCAVTLDGNGVQFVAAEAAVACTATVSYYAFPGVGQAKDDAGTRLEASFDLS